MNSADKLAALRDLLAKYELSGWLIPRADEHQGEYVAPYAERLRWMTGFDGSAGLAIVLADRAAIFVDGRYTLQARNQVDTSLFEVVPIADMMPAEWLARHAQGKVVGFDPWLHTENEIHRYIHTGIELVAMDGNLVDDIWPDQPARPLNPVEIYPIDFAGQGSADKRARIGQQMAADAAVLSNLDSIAWLLNIRGSDIPCTPVPLAFAVLHNTGEVVLFMDEAKLNEDLDKVQLYPYDGFDDYCEQLRGKHVLYDPKTGPIELRHALEAAGAQVVRGDDVCMMPKACKNETELAGIREAHKRDGAALVEFLAWLDEHMPVSELEASDKLRTFRAQKMHFKGLSFETIAGAGPNGAIVHYRVTPDTNRMIGQDEVFLLDSGAQYLDGTTDVTRTVVFQTPTAEQKDRFTRVLKGHIALAMAQFPAGTTGAALDVLARNALWQAGLDYQHGTGHGVGCYLSVHEGPQRIAKAMANDVGLRPGMVVSNEPGYYKEGAYGIRIESLVAVQERGQGFLGFETLTCAPICLDLVEVSLLTADERQWLNDYHAWVLQTLPDYIQPELKPGVIHWLERQTRALTDF